MSNSNSAWIDGITPEIPRITGLHSTELERLKLIIIRDTTRRSDLTFNELQLLGRSSEGLVHDDIRKCLWPKLLRLTEKDFEMEEDLENIHKLISNETYEQILKDVSRSRDHLPEDASEDAIEEFERELTKIMCWVLSKHTKLNYYQGFNDIAATVLLVMGLQQGLKVLEKIALTFLERFMEVTMEKVSQELFVIFALLDRRHHQLLEYLENVELFPHFALAEYTTWYAHKYANNRKLLHRLFDFFLGSPPLIPLYLSTNIVAFRDKEIFNTTPADMGHTHKVLSTLPHNLPFEDLLHNTWKLYEQYPPESIENDVIAFDLDRKSKEQEWKNKWERVRLEQERQRKLKISRANSRIPYIKNYKTITFVTFIAIGIYAFLKTSGFN